MEGLDRYERLKRELPAIAEILQPFPESLQGRVFDILVEQLLGQETAGEVKAVRERVAAPPLAAGEPVAREVAGIATLGPEGEFKFTLQDPKAKNTNDAARRLAHLALRAYERLTGEREVSFRHLLVPILKEWKAYTGNTRRVLAQDAGLARQGDLVSLTDQGREQADEFIRQVQDPLVKGTWKPGLAPAARRRGGRRRVAAAPVEAAVENEVSAAHEEAEALTGGGQGGAAAAEPHPEE